MASLDLPAFSARAPGRSERPPVDELVDWDPRSGRVQIRTVRRSAGLYYISTDVAINDAHGVGAFLLASAEIE